MHGAPAPRVGFRYYSNGEGYNTGKSSIDPNITGPGGSRSDSSESFPYRVRFGLLIITDACSTTIVSLA